MTASNASPAKTPAANEYKDLKEVTATPSGIVVPLADYPGEYVVFVRDWEYGQIHEVGQWIAGTTMSITSLLVLIVDWKLHDSAGNSILFDRAGLEKDQTPLFKLPANKARQLALSAFLAYSEASRLPPLQK